MIGVHVLVNCLICCFYFYELVAKYNEETSCHDVYKFCNSVMESLFTISVTVSNSSTNNTGITQAEGTLV